MAILFFVDGPMIGKIQSGQACDALQTSKTEIKLEPKPGNVLQPVPEAQLATCIRYRFSNDTQLAFYSCDRDYVREVLIREQHPKP